MRSYPLHEARSGFSKLFDRALQGEPQRITRYGRDAVVIVSEAEWERRRGRTRTLPDLLLEHGEQYGYADVFGAREPIASQERPLGTDVLGEHE